MTIDPKRIYQIESTETLKEKAFELMLTDEEYNGFDIFIAEIYYQGWSILFYKDNTNTLTLRYHKDNGFAQWKYFFTMGACWRYIFREILNIKYSSLTN